MHFGYLHKKHDKVLVQRSLWCIHRQSMCKELFDPAYFAIPNDYQGMTRRMAQCNGLLRSMLLRETDRPLIRSFVRSFCIGRVIVRCLHLWIVQHKLKVSSRLREGPRKGESLEDFNTRDDKARKSYIKVLFDAWWRSIRKSQTAHGTPMMLQDKTAKQAQKKSFAVMLMLDRCMKMKEVRTNRSSDSSDSFDASLTLTVMV